VTASQLAIGYRTRSLPPCRPNRAARTAPTTAASHIRAPQAAGAGRRLALAGGRRPPGGHGDLPRRDREPERHLGDPWWAWRSAPCSGAWPGRTAAAQLDGHSPGPVVPSADGVSEGAAPAKWVPRSTGRGPAVFPPTGVIAGGGPARCRTSWNLGCGVVVLAALEAVDDALVAESAHEDVDVGVALA